MKKHGITYLWLGEPLQFETDSLFECGKKIEELLNDPYVDETSVNFYSKEDTHHGKTTNQQR